MNEIDKNQNKTNMASPKSNYLDLQSKAKAELQKREELRKLLKKDKKTTEPTFEEKIKLVAKEKHLKIIRVEEEKIVALDKGGYKVTFEKIPWMEGLDEKNLMDLLNLVFPSIQI